jgi:hypothetical protein
MSYTGFITIIKNIRKHNNADRLQCGECFGNKVIVGMSTQEDELGVYFPVDGQLNIQFCDENNLVRRKDENGNNVGGYLDPAKRNIRALKLRGEISDGLFLPLASLGRFCHHDMLKEGDTIDVINGVVICQKYIPKTQYEKRRARKKTWLERVTLPYRTTVTYPYFEEHRDTEQFAYNTDAIKIGDIVTVSLKMHGTSQRTAYTIKRVNPWYMRMLSKVGVKLKPKESWGYVTGSRRMVLTDLKEGFRHAHHKFFEGKLKKGETVYYEIVGFEETGKPIMASCSNAKVKDKEFSLKWGDTTVFSYGCSVKESKAYVYRITRTYPNGDTFDYNTDQIETRCKDMGVEMCPVLARFMADGSEIMSTLTYHCNGADPIGETHIREGVVVRIENRNKFTAYKHKNFFFKVVEGIVKDEALEPDMEESQ